MLISRHIFSHSCFVIKVNEFKNFCLHYFNQKVSINKSNFELFVIKRTPINHPCFLTLMTLNWNNTLKLIRDQFLIFHRCHSNDHKNLIHLIYGILGIFLRLRPIKLLVFILVESLTLLDVVPTFGFMGPQPYILT